MTFYPKMLFMSTDDAGGGETVEIEEKPKLADLIKEHNLQDDMNAMMAENRRKLTQQNGELVKELEGIKRKAGLTQEEKDGLQTRITQLEEQYMTKEELAKREASSQQKQYEEKLTKAQKEQEQWRGRFADSTIQRSWQDAAINGEVLEQAVSQVSEMFKHRTSLVERMVDGQATGIFDPVVKFNDLNEDGNEVTLDLSPQDAIKRMRELPSKYGYLFRGTATSGIGGARSADGSAPPARLEELLKDPAKYAKWRKENPDLDLTKLR